MKHARKTRIKRIIAREGLIIIVVLVTTFAGYFFMDMCYNQAAETLFRHREKFNIKFNVLTNKFYIDDAFYWLPDRNLQEEEVLRLAYVYVDNNSLLYEGRRIIKILPAICYVVYLILLFMLWAIKTLTDKE